MKHRVILTLLNDIAVSLNGSLNLQHNTKLSTCFFF